MSEITKPILLNETGQETNQKLDTLAAKEQLIADAINNVAQNYTDIHAAAVSAQQQATAAAASAAAADNSAGDAADSAAAAAQKLDDLEAFLSGLDPESAASVAAELGLFEQEVASDYAKKDGYYEQMGVGTADNLAGHGTVNAEHTYRTAGGDSDIGTGAATIETVKVNTLVWNQLISNGNFETVSNWTAFRVSYTVSNNIAEIIVDSGQDDGYLLQAVSAIQGHKYFICGSLKAGANKGRLQPSGVFASVPNEQQYTAGTGNFERLAYITQANSTGNGNIQQRNYDTATPLYARDVVCFDLTKMFGSGYEPSTVGEFEALYPLNYYDYNSGTLINNAASGIKTIGFNQWDEQWELGSIDANGQPTSSTISWRCKNFIPVFPSMDYNIHFGGVVSNLLIYYYFYDAGYNYIPVQDNYVYLRDTIVTTPANARYMKFRIGGTVEYKTYNHDICINLSWSGYRNGEYEPYEEHTVYFDTDLGASGSLATIKGRKLNAQGEPTGDSVVVFPDGMKSVLPQPYNSTSATDEAKGQIGTVRIYGVNLSQLEYSIFTGVSTPSKWFYAQLPKSAINLGSSAYHPFMCPNYSVATTTDARYGGTGADKTVNVTGTNLFIRDDSCANADAFKAANNNVWLYYILATPETYLLDNPLPVNYVVNDFGTEQRLPADTSSSVMAPILYSVQYAMNATDTIRRLPINYISKDSFENFCASLASAIGPYLNPPATIAVTPTYNDNTQEYDYQVTVTPTENNG